MRILGIVGSPRKNGNTEILVKETLSSARNYGAETEVINISEMNITSCDGCESCIETGQCHIDDDMQDIYQKLLQSDGIIIGSPAYYWSVTAQTKALIDRTFVFRRKKQLRNKVAGAIVVFRGSGASFVLSTLYNYFNLQGLIPAKSTGYRTEEELEIERIGGGSGVIARADKRGEVKNNKEAIMAAQALGRAMVETLQTFNM
jgi:multimeric flavodoxin WrbA